MNAIAAIVVSATLCVGSYFWGQHEEAKELESVKKAMREETKHALDDVRVEVGRVEKEYNDKIAAIRKQWDDEINPLLLKAKAKCKVGAQTSSCQEANNAVLEAVFKLRKDNK